MIKINKILQRKAGIAGIPADVFMTALIIGLLSWGVVCGIFGADLMVLLVVIIILDGTWIFLTVKGVWRFIGTFHRPPIYTRGNISYTPVLSRLRASNVTKRKTKTSKSSSKKRRKTQTGYSL
jgi:hypothetical protein